MALIADEASQAQLLVAGLVSGSGLIALVVKFLLASPARETSAYKQGTLDEHNRNEHETEDLKTTIKKQEKELIDLRNNLLRLAVATDLTAAQKREIASMLGFKSTARMLQSDIPKEEN